MKTEVVLMTPQKAQALMSKNAVFNRELRPSTVSGLADAIRRGEWVVSHQGIAVSKSGVVLDGQHRLCAIVQADMAVPILVTTGVEDDAFKVIDIGLKRSNADVLNVSQHLAACARFLAVVEDKTSRASITPQYLVPFIKAIEDPLGRLLAFCPSTTRAWSAAAVRAAAVLRIMDGADENYVLMTYHSLVHLEYEDMPPIAQALVRQRERGTIHSANNEMFLRCLKVFNPAEAQMRTIQVSSTATLMDYAREVIAMEIRGQKKAPTAKAAGAKKPVKTGLKSTAAVH